MLISFILAGDFLKGEFERSLQSILSQSDDDYEIILCSDVPMEDSEISIYYWDLFWKTKKINTIILNDSSVGNSSNWNNALKVLNGEYFMFIKPGDTLDINIVSNIKKALVKNANKGALDIIEFCANLTGLAKSQTKTYIEKDRVYNLDVDFAPFAHVVDILFTKCYRRDVIENNPFSFKPFVEYELLFVYKFLSQAKTFISLETNYIGYIDIQISLSFQPVFDRVKQWSHIFNHFRRLGIYKDIKDYINYAYFKSTIHTWLWQIKRYNKKTLIIKSYDYITRKFNSKKRTEFIKQNKAYKNSEDMKFKAIMLNFDNYIEDFKKEN
ncbi:hypothetical protein [Spiroplasma endosymbiont of Aspidapion aeneum]|uniref:hypothetical protein n=1 Tax=Spiroplasma endosymbiont of Aspidapion aeneum TaxID=3066276 RepID=UPI00313C4865